MLLKMSFSAGILIVFVIIIRFLFLGRLPKKLFVLLWDIALIRLLLPIELPLPYGMAAPVMRIAESSIFSYADVIGNVAGNRMTAAGESVIDQAAAEVASETLALKNSLFNRIYMICDNLFSDSHFLMVLWLTGAFLLFVLFAVLYGREYRRIRDALPVPQKKEKKLRALAPIPARVKLLVSDRVVTPLTFGIISPEIILPKVLGPIEDTQLKYVLTHEAVHIKRADNLRKVLMLSAVCIHWFNPLVWLMLILSERDIELACDERVVYLLGENEKKEYARTLLYFSEKQSMLFSNGFGKKAVRERVEEIMKYKKLTIAGVLCGVLFTGIAVSAFAKTGLPAEAQATRQQTTESAEAADRGSFYLVADSEFFPEYAACGLSYDAVTGRLLYEGEVVSSFHDETAPGVYTHITGGEGTIDVRIARNKLNQIIGVQSTGALDHSTSDAVMEQSSDYITSDFSGEATTDMIKGQNGNIVTADFYASQYAGTDYTYQNGGQNVQMLEEYEEYKIEYDVQGWTYDGKWINGLLDEDKKYIFVNDGYPYAGTVESVYLLLSGNEMTEISKEDFEKRMQGLFKYIEY